MFALRHSRTRKIKISVTFEFLKYVAHTNKSFNFSNKLFCSLHYQKKSKLHKFLLFKPICIQTFYVGAWNHKNQIKMKIYLTFIVLKSQYLLFGVLEDEIFLEFPILICFSAASYLGAPDF